MKFLSNNLMLLVLATVLAISPLKVIASSVSDCMDADKNMHYSMNKSPQNHSTKASNKSSHHQEVKSGTQQDCCETTACDMTHCASFVAIAVTADTQSGIIYTLSEVSAKPSESLISFYPSSLYRPPKA